MAQVAAAMGYSDLNAEAAYLNRAAYNADLVAGARAA